MKNAKNIRDGFTFIAKLFVGIVIVLPVLYGFFASFMSPGEFATMPPHFVPYKPILDNYSGVLDLFPVFRFIFNSFFVCAIVIAGQILTCSFAAFGFSFYRFKGRGFLFMLILSTMMIPADVTIIANFLTIMNLRLNDTYPGLVLPYLTSSMGIFLIRQFFLSIPKELHEAAIMDGCQELRFLFKIVIPISVPALASLGIYIFIGIYNQFFWPLLVTNTDMMRTVQIGMYYLLSSENGTNYGVVMAGFVLTLAPAIIAFVIGQKRLVKGMTAGAVKG
jgi:sn-glycerol 3-phosphate transport system permease protein